MEPGGTCFADAMVKAAEVVGRENVGRQVQLVFMSDGAAYDAPQAASTMASIVSAHSNIGVEVIAFGEDADMAALDVIARAGGTTAKRASTGSLTKMFVNIARGASVASEELYTEICSRIAEEVSTQLMLEYL